MTIDLNTAKEQGGGFTAIPEDSVVVVVAQIRSPGTGKEGTVHPMLCKANSGYEYLDFEFTVMTPKFEGRKIWQNYMMVYTKPETEKSQMAIGISMRTLRAIVEASRNISPKDSSPEATKGRIINDFSDINNMMFPVVVDVEWSLPNASDKRYLNNTIKRIVTPDDERFKKVYADKEWLILSDKPLPPEPPKHVYDTSGAAGGANPPAWATGGKSPAPEPAKTATGGKPTWMK